jgi:pimeloyl-ACP methyl ester carboxylesterase
LALPGLGVIGVVLPARWLLAMEFARQRRRARAVRQSVALRDGELVYLRTGQGGVPRLYIHGFAGMKENWLAMLAATDRRCKQYAPDLPGWGESERREGLDYGFAAQADRLAEFIAREIGEPVDVIGHSMGGGIAVMLAADHPSWVRRLVLMDAAGVRFSDNAFGQAVLDGENPFAVHDEASFKRFMALVFERPPKVPRSVLRYFVVQRQAQAGFEQSVLDQIGRGPEAFLPQVSAARIDMPTLLLWCRGDRVVDPSAAAIYAAIIPSSRTVMIDGCGHMPMMENTTATVTAIEEFLQ